MKKNWVLNSPVSDAQKVADEFKIHVEIAAILLRRGLKTSSEIFSFLNPSLSGLEDPFVFEDMKKAVDRIRRAIATSEKILVYGDYDVDGITGTAILFPILKKMGADVEAYIPHRMNEGYGLNQKALERLLEKKFGLVITVDNGITGVEPIQFLKTKGVDVIIVDHHTPKGGLPPAYAIVSASVGNKKGDPNLAACGVAFKLGWALTGSFEAVKEYLDLVAVGTVADIAPVLGDNRILLRHGLAALSQTQRPGFQALMDVARIQKRVVSYRDIAFGLGPRINASGRMGSPDNSFKLLTTESAQEARELAQILDDGNRDRQRVESFAFDQARERVEKEYSSVDERVLVVESHEWHEGVLGIVAARLVERFQKPSIVISLKDDVGKGSGRSIPSFSIFDSVLKCEHLLDSFGGHAQACGLSIQKENIGLFRKQLNEVAAQSEPADFGNPFLIESNLSLDQLDLKFLKDLARLEPFGPGHKNPLFLSQGLRVKGPVRKRGKDTMQCWMTDARGKVTCELIGFRAYQRWNNAKQDSYSVVYQPTLRDFNGIASLQLELEDWC